MRKTLLLSVAFFGLAMSVASAGPNLVVNGSFETGDLTGWTVSGLTGVTTNPAFVSDGSFGVSYGNVGSASPLYQDITTVVGQAYTFSFDQKTLAGFTNEFDASFGGVQLLNLFDSPVASLFTHYSFTVVATSTTSRVEFDLRQDPAFSALDNVSVNSIDAVSSPEPSTFAGAALTVVVGGIVARIRRRRVGAAV